MEKQDYLHCQKIQWWKWGLITNECKPLNEWHWLIKIDNPYVKLVDDQLIN